MAQAKENTAKQPKVRYFRCATTSALRILKDGERIARFKPYLETYQGDPVKVGYLATSDPVVVERCVEDYTVEEIEKKEFDKATGPKSLALPVNN